MRDFSNYWKALTYAVEKYGDLTRKFSDLPYIIHPVRITAILRAGGYSEYEHEDLFIATLFHDLVEDTPTKLEEIEQVFGSKIASIVNEVSKPDNKSKDEWLEDFDQFSAEARILKMADRIDNLLDMRDWSSDYQKVYAKQAKIILKKCREADENLAKKLEEIISSFSDLD